MCLFVSSACKQHSTSLAVLEVIDECYKKLDEGYLAMGIYFDLQKAFDTVNHDILLKKLYNYGIRGKMHKWFTSYLRNRRQYCCINNTVSEVLNINCGVPQGSVLGPLLFIIYVNDIPNSIISQADNLIGTKLQFEKNNDSNNKLRLFADDTNLFVFAKTLDDLYSKSNNCIREMEKWFGCNRLCVNVAKTCYTVFAPRPAMDFTSLQLTLYGSPLSLVKECKYLGIVIDDCLKWNLHIDAVYKSIARFTSVFFKLRSILPSSVLKNLYYSLIHSRILSGIELYGCTDLCILDRLIKINNKILRILQNKRLECPLYELYKSYDTLPIPALYQYQILLIIFKSIHFNSKLPFALQNYFISNSDIHIHNTRFKSDLHIFPVEKNIGAKNIAFAGGRLWNKLPSYLKEIQSVDSFKSKIKIYLRDLYFAK